MPKNLSDLIPSSPPAREIITRIPIFDLNRQVSILKNDNQKLSIRLLVVFTFVFSIGYFILPFDIIPDVLLGLGYLDDLAIYSFLREVAYEGAEEKYGIKKSIVKTLKSKVFLSMILLIVALFLLFSTIVYLTINPVMALN
jgi:uncharacterized membrane protein YkvA (DUF1232 family)